MIHNKVGDKRWFGRVRRKLMNELMRWVEKIEEVCSKRDKGILKKKIDGEVLDMTWDLLALQKIWS